MFNGSACGRFLAFLTPAALRQKAKNRLAILEPFCEFYACGILEF
nr:hypothetical protein [uncultured Campylobacter sp.]